MSDVTLHDTEAVVERTELSIALPAIPSVAVHGLETLRAKIAQIEDLFAGYGDGVSVDPSTYAQAKKERAWLRNIQKSVDQKRKDAKAAYLKPVTELQAFLDAEIAPVNALIATIDTAVKEFEEHERTEKAARIREHWYEFAGFLADAIDYELVAEPAWANRSVTLEKAKQELEAKAVRIKGELDSLDALELKHSEEARAEYIATLDLTRALAKDKEITDREARAAELKAEQDAYNAANRPEPAPEPIDPLMEAVARAEAASARAAGVSPVDVEREWTIRIRATRADVERLVRIIKDAGFSGRISAS